MSQVLDNRTRNTDIDILRGIGAVSVVIGHAMNAELFSSAGAEFIRRFVYLYHLPIFFFCAGYFFRCESIIACLRKLWKQYKLMILFCFGSYFFIPLWVKMGAIEMPLIGEIVRKSINILLFREDGYYVGAMWFVPFMATTTIIYAVLYLVFMKSNTKCFEPACIICGIMGVLLVSRYGIGKRYIYISMLMTPVMLAGALYTKYESKIKNGKWLLIPNVLCMTTVCLSGGGQVELSKGLILNGWLFYPVIFCGIVFCILIKDIIKSVSASNKIFSALGQASAYIMGLHFIAFKLIDVIAYKAKIIPIEISAFPIGSPKLRVCYIIFGLLLPIAWFKVVCVLRSVMLKHEIYKHS